jgi:hypothetical protein
MNKVTTGDNNYCGPAVLSVVSGRSVDYCARIIGEIIGKAPDKVKGVYPADLFKAAARLRIRHEKIEPPASSLFAVASNLVHRGEATYILEIPKHYIAIEVTAAREIFLCDNHTKEPINLAGSARLSQKVEQIWKCSVKPAAVLIRDTVEVVEVKNSADSAYYINIIKEYEDPEDNFKCSKGLFRADRNELKIIAAKLTEMSK